MSRLFVDVDDTLIVRNGRDWCPNRIVGEFVRDWHARNPAGEIVVWSMRGPHYAARFATNLLRDIPHRAMGKTQLAPLEGDLFIDDNPYPVFASASVHPGRLREYQEANHG